MAITLRWGLMGEGMSLPLELGVPVVEAGVGSWTCSCLECIGPKAEFEPGRDYWRSELVDAVDVLSAWRQMRELVVSGFESLVVEVNGRTVVVGEEWRRSDDFARIALFELGGLMGEW